MLKSKMVKFEFHGLNILLNHQISLFFRHKAINQSYGLFQKIVNNNQDSQKYKGFHLLNVQLKIMLQLEIGFIRHLQMIQTIRHKNAQSAI